MLVSSGSQFTPVRKVGRVGQNGMANELKIILVKTGENGVFVFRVMSNE